MIEKGDQVQIGHFPGELEPRVKERYTYNGEDRMGPGGAKSGPGQFVKDVSLQQAFLLGPAWVS